jgi:acyl-CoA thioester hydrolase
MAQKYVKAFDVRWSDIDANLHLIHTAYSGYMAHTRMCFLDSKGITMEVFARDKLGPVLLNEHIHFVREIRPMETVFVDIELSGMTEDYRIFRFDQGLYNSEGTLAAYSRLMVCFIDMTTRKMKSIPDKWKPSIDDMIHTHDFALLQKEDLRATYLPLDKKIDLPI